MTSCRNTARDGANRLQVENHRMADFEGAANPDTELIAVKSLVDDRSRGDQLDARLGWVDEPNVSGPAGEGGHVVAAAQAGCKRSRPHRPQRTQAR